jgi:hypothetical protein
MSDLELMRALVAGAFLTIICTILAIIFWNFVAAIWHRLEARNAMDALRPRPWEVADAEAELPEMRDGWHLEPAHLVRPGDRS